PNVVGAAWSMAARQSRSVGNASKGSQSPPADSGTPFNSLLVCAQSVHFGSAEADVTTASRQHSMATTMHGWRLVMGALRVLELPTGITSSPAPAATTGSSKLGGLSRYAGTRVHASRLFPDCSGRVLRAVYAEIGR